MNKSHSSKEVFKGKVLKLNCKIEHPDSPYHPPEVVGAAEASASGSTPATVLRIHVVHVLQTNSMLPFGVPGRLFGNEYVSMLRHRQSPSSSVAASSSENNTVAPVPTNDSPTLEMLRSTRSELIAHMKTALVDDEVFCEYLLMGLIGRIPVEVAKEEEEALRRSKIHSRYLDADGFQKLQRARRGSEASERSTTEAAEQFLGSEDLAELAKNPLVAFLAGGQILRRRYVREASNELYRPVPLNFICTNKNLAKTTARLLTSIHPYVVHARADLDALQASKPFRGAKDAEGDKSTGFLELAPNTLLVVDETHAREGELKDEAVFNAAVLQQVLAHQKVPLHFCVYSVGF